MSRTAQVRYSIRERRSRWLALKLNIVERTGEREPKPPRSLAAPLRGYPANSSTRDIATARRMILAGELLKSKAMVMSALNEGLSEASELLAALSPDAEGAPWRLTLHAAVCAVQQGSLGHAILHASKP